MQSLRTNHKSCIFYIDYTDYANYIDYSNFMTDKKGILHPLIILPSILWHTSLFCQYELI